MPDKHDITTEKDVELLVDRFYKKVLPDPVIGYIFADVARLSWDTHIPKINAFWKSLLLDKPGYSGNPMAKHIELDKKTPLKPEHFERWLLLWKQTVNEHFEGPVADKAIKQANSIALLMQHKVENNRQ